MSSSEAFALLPDLTLAVSGDEGAVAHFRREYAGRESTGQQTADVHVEFVSEVDEKRPYVARGGHKSVAWNVGLSAPDERPLRLDLAIRGWPRSFALSLVQGYFVEPSVSLASPPLDSVLLPSAAVGAAGSVTLLLGRSRTGKSTLSLRALVGNETVLGDDQVFVDASGVCWSFPRRIRFYTDIRLTAPVAYSRLPARVRARVTAFRALKQLSRGFVAPSIAVDRRAFGAALAPANARIDRVLLIERSADALNLEVRDAALEEVVSRAATILDEQRSHLPYHDEPSQRTIVSLREREADVLRRALANVRAQRVLVPTGWPAGVAIPAVERVVRSGTLER